MIISAWTSDAWAQLNRTHRRTVANLYTEWLRGEVKLITDESRTGWIVVQQIDDEDGREVLICALAGRNVLPLVRQLVRFCIANDVDRVTGIAWTKSRARLYGMWGRIMKRAGELKAWSVQADKAAAPPTSAKTPYSITWVTANRTTSAG